MQDLNILAKIPAEEYHAAAKRGEFLSSHLLGDFRKSPRLYHRKMTGEIAAEDTAAFQMGRAVHTLVLEGRGRFDEEFMVSDGPINPKTGDVFGRFTKTYREWASAQRLPVISGADFGLISKIQSSVWTHPVAGDLVSDGVAERTVRTTYCGEPCQIRMDWFREDYGGRPVICDLKTCDSIDWFESDCWKYGYQNQMAFYRRVLEVASDGEISPDVYLIAVEKREPYRCAVYKLTDGLLANCASANEQAIAELKECRTANEWPTRTEDLRILDI